MSHITVSTTQFDISDEPVIERAPASYKVVNGSVYISYETAGDASENGHTAASAAGGASADAHSGSHSTRTIIKINEKSLEVRREGAVRGKLKYASGETAVSLLDLGFSVLEVKNITHSIAMLETDDTLAVTVRYDLYINEGFVSDCGMEILLIK